MSACRGMLVAPLCEHVMRMREMVWFGVSAEQQQLLGQVGIGVGIGIGLGLGIGRDLTSSSTPTPNPSPTLTPPPPTLTLTLTLSQAGTSMRRCCGACTADAPPGALARAGNRIPGILVVYSSSYIEPSDSIAILVRLVGGAAAAADALPPCPARRRCPTQP